MSAPTIVYVAAVIAISGGAVLAMSGLALLAIVFSDRSISIGAAGLFVPMTLGGGLILLLVGGMAMAAGFRLPGGHAWARTALEAFGWLLIAASVAIAAVQLWRKPEIESVHLIRAALFLAVSCLPAAALLLILRWMGASAALGR